MRHDRNGGMPAVSEAGGVAAGSGGVTADGGVSAVLLCPAAGGLAADGGLAAEETSCRTGSYSNVEGERPNRQNPGTCRVVGEETSPHVMDPVRT